MPEDLYQVLGVSRDATKDALQKAYRKLARRYHPDMNPEDDAAREKFKRVQEAYDVLSDPEKRAAYDRYGADFEKIRSGGWHPGQGGGPQFEGVDLEQIFGGGGTQGFEGGFAEFFEQLVGRGGGRARHQQAYRQPRRPSRGANLRHELSVPLQTAVTGGKIEFYLQRPTEPEKISVHIPAGVETGSKIRLRGKGYPSHDGGQPGDLILELRVSDHPAFERRGHHLHLKLPVSLAEAALGAKIDVPTPQGTVTLTIPPGSSGGKRLRLKGLGVRQSTGPSGDLIVELQIHLPSHWTAESLERIRQLDADNPVRPRDALAW